MDTISRVGLRAPSLSCPYDTIFTECEGMNIEKLDVSKIRNWSTYAYSELASLDLSNARNCNIWNLNIIP